MGETMAMLATVYTYIGQQTHDVNKKQTKKEVKLKTNTTTDLDNEYFS